MTDVVATADYKEAFLNADVAILVGAMPRREGMERKDLLKANAKIFEGQGKAINDYAKKTIKVLHSPQVVKFYLLTLNWPTKFSFFPDAWCKKFGNQVTRW